MCPFPATDDAKQDDPGQGALLGVFVAATLLAGVGGVAGIASGSVLLWGLAILGVGQAIEMGAAWRIGHAAPGPPTGPAPRQPDPRVPAGLSVLNVAGLVIGGAALVPQMGLRSPWIAGACLLGGTAIAWIALWGLAGGQTLRQRRATGRMLEILMLWGGASCLLILATGLSPRGQLADLVGGILVFAWAWGRAGRWCQTRIVLAMAGPHQTFNVGLFNAQVRGLAQVRWVDDTQVSQLAHDRWALMIRLTAENSITPREITSLKQRIHQLAGPGRFDDISIDVGFTTQARKNAPDPDQSPRP